MIIIFNSEEERRLMEYYIQEARVQIAAAKEKCEMDIAMELVEMVKNCGKEIKT